MAALQFFKTEGSGRRSTSLDETLEGGKRKFPGIGKLQKFSTMLIGHIDADHLKRE
jgi:hypothetical protein